MLLITEMAQKRSFLIWYMIPPYNDDYTPWPKVISTFLKYLSKKIAGRNYLVKEYIREQESYPEANMSRHAIVDPICFPKDPNPKMSLGTKYKIKSVVDQPNCTIWPILNRLAVKRLNPKWKLWNFFKAVMTPDKSLLPKQNRIPRIIQPSPKIKQHSYWLQNFIDGIWLSMRKISVATIPIVNP